MYKPTYATNKMNNSELIEKLRESNDCLDTIRGNLYKKVLELANEVDPDYSYNKTTYLSLLEKTYAINPEHIIKGSLYINNVRLAAPTKISDLINTAYSYTSKPYGSSIEILNSENEDNDISWIEIQVDNKSLYICAIPLLIDITLDELKELKLSNTIITLNDTEYKLRNLILNNDYNEFNTIVDSYKDDVNTLFNMTGYESITDPLIESEVMACIGGSSVDNISIYSDELPHQTIAWRPVLEEYDKFSESNETLNDIYNILSDMVEELKRSDI